MTQKAKTYMLPVAMATGSLAGYLLPDLTARWATLLAPILIFAMLLVTYCKISPNDLHIKPLHGWLLAVQIIGGLTIFGALYFWAVSYTHLRAHETGRNLVCRLLLEKKKKKIR